MAGMSAVFFPVAMRLFFVRRAHEFRDGRATGEPQPLTFTAAGRAAAFATTLPLIDASSRGLACCLERAGQHP
jgi:hypothetical protein